MEGNASVPLVGTRCRHVDTRPGGRGEPPQGRGRVMAQSGAGPAGEDSGHPAAVRRQAWVPDRIDADMHAMESPDREPIVDSEGGHAERDQLASSHDAMLVRRKRFDRALAWVRLARYFEG